MLREIDLREKEKDWGIHRQIERQIDREREREREGERNLRERESLYIYIERNLRERESLERDRERGEREESERRERERDIEPTERQREREPSERKPCQIRVREGAEQEEKTIDRSKCVTDVCMHVVDNLRRYV